MSDNPTQDPKTANPPKDEPPQKADNQPLLAGKYRSVEDLEKGYWELSKEGLRQRDARVRAEAERDAVLNQVQQMSRPAQGGKDPLVEAFAEADIPIEALDARVEAKALGILQNLMQPVMQQQQAEMKLAETHPDWPGTNEIIKALSPDAAESYRKLLATSPEAAMTLGYTAWKAAKVGTPAQTAVDAASRQVASSPPKRGGGSVQTTAEDQTKYRELLAEAIQTGDWTKFTRYRFGDQPWHKQITEGEY